MKTVMIVAVILITSCQVLGAVDLRIGAGGEILLWGQGSLVSRNGYGVAARVDIVWNKVTTSTIDFGWRRWPSDNHGQQEMIVTGKEIKRLGLCQRLYLPFDRVKPYLGGELLLQRFRLTSDYYGSDWDDSWNLGAALIIGGEIPIGASRFALDGSTSVEFDGRGDLSTSGSYFCIGLAVLWRAFN